jgi:hypothetical protein
LKRLAYNGFAGRDHKPPPLAVNTDLGSFGPMGLHFKAEQETHLAQLATKTGTDAEHLVKDAVLPRPRAFSKRLI